MRGKLVLVCALICITSSPVVQPPPVRTSSFSNTELQGLRTKAFTLYQSGRFLEAAEIYQHGYDQAIRQGDRAAALRFLNNLGGVWLAMFQYRQAMQVFLEARRLARATGDIDALATVSSNLSSLYLQQRDLSASLRTAEEALPALRRRGLTQYAPLLRTQSAIVQARQGAFDVALATFGEAIQEAEAQGDPIIVAMIWDQLGYEFMQRGQLDEAEHALLEAFRLRKLNHLADIQYSYYTLGMLSLARGNAHFACRLFDASIAGATASAGTLPSWRLYYERGRARIADGRVVEALADFENALESARRLRLEVLPADSVWINTGVDQHRVYSALIRASGALHFQTGNPYYARLAFDAAEGNRAASLRALIYSAAEWQRRLPPEYWEALAQLRSAEADLLARDSPAARKQLSSLLYKLTEMEAEAGGDLAPEAAAGAATGTPALLERVRKSLGGEETFLSFHLDEPDSFQWMVTRESFSMRRLPARSHISALVKEFQRAVMLGLPESVSLGEQLYSDLFGSAPAGFLGKTHWVLALDGDLFELPFAALVAGRRAGKPAYLVELRSVRIVPSALLFEQDTRQHLDGPFVGVGDPIYNTADPRWSAVRGDRSLLASLSRILARSRERPAMELARLAGSGREITACMNAWRADPSGSILLTGADASLNRLNEALGRRPSILHFATHFLKAAGDAPQALIALSLGPEGSPELLGSVEISRWRRDLGVVVLSGCGSALAETLPAEGLMGMTRAWLAAGAHSVVASLWPTPDDSGRLFVSFYRHLAELSGKARGRSAAEALRLAQLDMLRAGPQPLPASNWAAYFTVGKE